MPFAAYALKLLAIAETMHRWLAILSGLDRTSRERVADYAEQIAATLERAGRALAKLGADVYDRDARNQASRELSRIAGYVETLVVALDEHLDGRKLAGVKRRLDALDAGRVVACLAGSGIASQVPVHIERLAEAEGYFRALADGLRT